MNSVVLIGRLVADPELRYIPSTGNAVGTFTLAVDRAFTKDGQKQTDFFNIVVWGKQAEAVANYTSKGSQVAVRGNIQNRSYEAQDGTKKYITEIVAEQVQFLSKAPGESTTKSGTPELNSQDVAGYTALQEDDVPF